MTEDESSAATVAGLSVPQKASLCLGSDYWHTAGVSEFGIEPVMLSDGPHGQRKQPQPAAQAATTRVVTSPSAMVIAASTATSRPPSGAGTGRPRRWWHAWER